MAHSTSPTDRPHRDESDFHTSWRRLLASGRTVLALTEADEWRRARELLRARTRLSNEHFARFPVGPAHSRHYAAGLSELFSIEMDIERVFATSADSRRRAPRLRLVRQARD